MDPPWSGWIQTTGDALLILEAARQGLIPRVTRRLVDSERKMIDSGSVFVFDEEESGIRRWTDGYNWSPSRILGNFMLYREVGSRRRRKNALGAAEGQDEIDDSSVGEDNPAARALLGSLLASTSTSLQFKPNGLIKKSFSVTINGVPQHLISYYRIPDVLSGRLRTPSSLPELVSLSISDEYLDKVHFRIPPKIELDVNGHRMYRGEADDEEAAAAAGASVSLRAPLLGEPIQVRAPQEGTAASAGDKRKRSIDDDGDEEDARLTTLRRVSEPNTPHSVPSQQTPQPSPSRSPSTTPVPSQQPLPKTSVPQHPTQPAPPVPPPLASAGQYPMYYALPPGYHPPHHGSPAPPHGPSPSATAVPTHYAYPQYPAYYPYAWPHHPPPPPPQPPVNPAPKS